MKKTFIAMLGTCFTLFISCQGEQLPIKDELVKQNILGKWMLVKHKEETYSAANTIAYKNERAGDKSDSIIFKPNGKLYTYSDIDGSEIIDYEVIDDQTLRVENEHWKIVTLTATQLDLLSEETDPVTKEKDVASASFKRP